MQGWIGTILQVDLGKGQITKDHLDEGFAASYDAIVIKGKAKKPVYLWI
ncbi:hypothetical protein ACFLWB_03055 [Chloroflexota bacterium]